MCTGSMGGELWSWVHGPSDEGVWLLGSWSMWEGMNEHGGLGKDVECVNSIM